MSVRRLRPILAAAVLAAAASSAAAQAGAALVDAVPSLTVEGEARREVTPDLAVLTLGVTTDRATAAQASEDNARAAAALVAVARDAGVLPADIQTARFSLSAVMDARDASKLKGFRASNAVTLRLRDMARVGTLVGQLTASGANTIDGVAFEVADPQPILDDLRRDATQDAVRKAGIYAAAAKLKLGRVLRIAPLDAAPVSMARSFKLQMAEAAPAPPVEAGAQRLESRVQVTWELVP